MNAAVLWQYVLERLEQHPLDGVTRTWLRAARLTPASTAAADDIEADPSSLDEPALCFLLRVPTRLARERLQQHWQRQIEEALVDVTGQPVVLKVVADQGPQEAFTDEEMTAMEDTHTVANRQSSEYAPYYDYDIPGKPPTRPQRRYEDETASRERNEHPDGEWEQGQPSAVLMPNRLNPRYTFDAFIVGNSNRLAHAASLAVAEAPGESYNPLFLYGGVGLGKTHLLHAIGHQGVQTGLAVLYVSSEQFTNEIVNAIRYRTTEEFRAKYRSVDILLVDDIQFIAGKESTEEEFFHTFNSLYEMSKQIVICSDRPPKAIVSLEERLRSRFEWGLIADIQPPDLETRMAILRVKADLLHYPIPDEIIAYIASRVQTNIRELEGCLNRLMAYQQLHRTELTLDVARAAMSSLGNDNRESHLSSRQIAQTVAEYFHIPLEAICGKQRDKHIVIPRQIAMYLIRQETQASLLEIGQLFGGRDHSTVLHACEKIDRAMNLDPGLRRDVVAIREQLLHR